MKIFKRCISLAVVTPLVVTLAACSGAGQSISTLPGKSAAMVSSDSTGGSTSTQSTASGAAGTHAVKISATARSLATGSPSGIMALSADSLPGDHDAGNNFIDSIGTNTHLTYSGVYQNYQSVKSALVNLGVRHIRDTFVTTNPMNYESNLADLATSGIHSVLCLSITEDPQNNAVMTTPADQAVAYVQAGHFLTSMEAFEGINEPDVNQSNFNAPPPVGWAALTQAQQQLLYTSVQGLVAPAKPMPVYGPSPQTTASELTQVGNLSAYMDFGNMHDYSGGYNLPDATITANLSLEQGLSGSKPVIATENGYATGSTGQGMPDVVMLDYSQRLFFKQFADGVKRTLWYELLDENTTPNDYWHNAGLLTANYAPKPSYVGLQNIISLLKDQTSYKSRTALNVSFGGQIQFENLDQLLLQKNDGSFWLAVWRDQSEWTPANNGVAGSYPTAIATVANSMNFIGTYVSSITEYDEDDTGAMTSHAVTVSSGSSAQVSVGGRPRIFKIVPGVAPHVAAGAPVISTPAAHWSLDEAGGSVAADSVDPTGNLAVPSNTSVGWLTGAYNAGLSFSGTQATTADVPLDTTQSYSATAWVQLSSLSGYQAAVAVNGLTNAAFAIDFTPQSNLSFTVYGKDATSTPLTRIGSTIVPVIGKWYPVAVTYNGTSRLMSLYVNGTLQSTGTAGGVFKAAGGTEIGSMLQGGIGHWQWLNGGVDEVNLYARELTPTDVKTMAGM